MDDYFGNECCFNICKKANSVNVLMLGIVGLTIFELLFEARARYLFLIFLFI